MNKTHRFYTFICCVSIFGTLMLALLIASEVSGQTYNVGHQNAKKVPLLGLDTPTETVVSSGADEFNPYDDRVEPRAGDRVAVYCYSKYRDIDVWGVDDQSQGIYLYTFDYDDLYAAGTAGLAITLKDNGTVSLTTDGQANFLLFWNGPFNNTGHGDFRKSFHCLFPGGSATPRPNTPKAVRSRSVVYTVTPAPTVTPIVTQSLY